VFLVLSMFKIWPGPNRLQDDSWTVKIREDVMARDGRSDSFLEEHIFTSSSSEWRDRKLGHHLHLKVTCVPVLSSPLSTDLASRGALTSRMKRVYPAESVSLLCRQIPGTRGSRRKVRCPVRHHQLLAPTPASREQR
jgi:hypothetical protein